MLQTNIDIGQRVGAKVRDKVRDKVGDKVWDIESDEKFRVFRCKIIGEKDLKEIGLIK